MAFSQMLMMTNEKWWKRGEQHLLLVQHFDHPVACFSGGRASIHYRSIRFVPLISYQMPVGDTHFCIYTKQLIKFCSKSHLTFHSNWLKDLQCLTPIGWKIFGDRRVRCCSCWSCRASSLQIRAIKKGRKENNPFFSFRVGTVVPNKIFGPWDINLAAKGRLWRQLSVGENLWHRKVKYCLFKPLL